MRQWRTANRERNRENYRRWALANRERRREQWRNYRRKHRARVLARTAINIAIRAGKITRQPCQVCGAPDAQAHHPDYRQPLTVRWLCRVHHIAHHLIETL